MHHSAQVQATDFCLDLELERYLDGEQTATTEDANNLTDVLFCFHRHGLGRIIVLQESNQHIVFQVFGALEEDSFHDRRTPAFLAGYLSGLLKQAHWPEHLEVAFGEMRGCSCVFSASW